MNVPPEIRLVAATATGVAAFALLMSHLRKPAEQAIKKGLVSDPDRVGKPTTSGLKGTGLSQSNGEFDYDFIIIGGGTAGSAIASRLSERPDFSVLLLEAGASGVVLRMSRVPFAYGGLMGSNHDWSLFTAPQIGCDNRRIFWSRTKLLGGCSSGNALLFHYGAPTDYDEWASASDEPECKEWEFAQFSHSFRKFETFHPHPDFPVDESTRGSCGPVQTGFYGYFSNLAQAFVSACKSVGIPFNPDLNTAQGTIGVSKVMTFMTSPPTRCSAEAAYLTPTVLARPNLTVATHAHVTRILFEGQRAVGVEFARAQDAPRYQARARKEIILCAGTVHTPHILMHSGVGPAQELEKHNIPVVHDLPGVGDHLMDHVLVPTRYRTTPGESLCYLNLDTGKGFLNAVRRTRAIWQYFLTKSGPLTTNVAEAICFFRSDDPKLFPGLPPLDEDSTSGPNAPDIELVLMPLGFGVASAPEGHLMTIAALSLRPTSTGRITLASNNPFNAPVIDPKQVNYLNTQHDVDVLVRGLRVALRLSQEEPLRSMIVQTDTSPDLDLSLLNADDATLAKQVRARAETGYHPTSTARIGSVVDARLRVYGLEGLRVADCSVIPTIISGHTEAAALAIGEKAADIIKAAHPSA